MMEGRVWNIWRIYTDRQTYFILTHALSILCTPVSPASQQRLDVEPCYMFAGPAVTSLCGYCLWSAEVDELYILWRLFESCCSIMKDVSLKQEQRVVLEGSCKSSRCELFSSCTKLVLVHSP